MGLPARYEHPEHGLCLTLHAALAYLKERGMNCTHERDEIIVLIEMQERRIAPLVLPLGKMYPVSAFEV